MSAELVVNREGHPGFDVAWPWLDGLADPGLTAVLRVKDEARNLGWVLPPLLRCVDAVLLVDNRSTDGTADVARRLAREQDCAERLRVVEYPFAVSRCGREHLQTPADSVHSLTHFYNWAFAQARSSYTLKWDGDMVLTEEGVAMIADLAWQLEGEETMVVFQHFPLYVESDRVGYVDLGLHHREPWIHPQGPAYTYVKGFDWEIRQHPDEVRRLTMPPGICFELKWLDSDEFDHWTSPGDVDPVRSPRKAREHAVFDALSAGRHDALESVHRVEAPAGVHVVDHVARDWLPSRPRPLER